MNRNLLKIETDPSNIKLTKVATRIQVFRE